MAHQLSDGQPFLSQSPAAHQSDVPTRARGEPSSCAFNFHDVLTGALTVGVCSCDRRDSTGGGKADKDAVIQARQDGAVGAALLLALPPAFYAAVHWAALGAWTHAWSLAILAAAPWCLLLATDGAPCHAPAPAAMRNHPACSGAMPCWVRHRTMRPLLRGLLFPFLDVSSDSRHVRCQGF